MTLAEFQADIRAGIPAELPALQPYDTTINHAPKRKRKLLLHGAQIDKLRRQIQAKGYTIVPLQLYFNEDGRAKLKIALARGKKEYDKRQALREEQDKREALRMMRYKNMHARG